MNEELLPVVDESGNLLGSATREECHSGSMILHPVVHLHIINSNGDILLQRRSVNKRIQPGKWDTAVGGHVDYGESVQQALIRETSEELGIDASTAKFHVSYLFHSDIERELINVHILRPYDELPDSYSREEIDEVRFWTKKRYYKASAKVFLPRTLSLNIPRY